MIGALFRLLGAMRTLNQPAKLVRTLRAGAFLLLALWLWPAALVAGTPPAAQALLPAADKVDYVGAASCALCHNTFDAQWSESRHSKMVQPATAQSVKGDFKRGRIRLHGSLYSLQQREGKYYVTESYLTGKPLLQTIARSHAASH